MRHQLSPDDPGVRPRRHAGLEESLRLGTTAVGDIGQTEPPAEPLGRLGVELTSFLELIAPDARANRVAGGPGRAARRGGSGIGPLARRSQPPRPLQRTPRSLDPGGRAFGRAARAAGDAPGRVARGTGTDPAPPRTVTGVPRTARSLDTRALSVGHRADRLPPPTRLGPSRAGDPRQLPGRRVDCPARGGVGPAWRWSTALGRTPTSGTTPIRWKRCSPPE